MLKSFVVQFCLVLTLILVFLPRECCGTLDDDISYQLDKRKNGGNHFLSRKRRYLTFPEGSSFQVVFCLTYPSIAVGSFFVFGNTAALAWELPSTPIFYNYKDFKTTTTEAPTTTEAWHIEDLIHDDHDFDYTAHDGHDFNYKGQDFGYKDHQPTPDFDYIDHHQYNNKDRFDRVDYENGYPVSSYYNPFSDYATPQKNGFSPHPQKKEYYSSSKSRYFNNVIINNDNSRKAYDTSKYPTYRKPMERQHDNYDKTYEETRSYSKFSRQGTDKRRQVNPSSSYVDPIYHGIHRRTRRDLYQKLQQFLTTLNLDGKNCILKAICEVNQKSKEKGTFIEEIIKTIFRIKPEDGYPNEDHFDYAANKTHVCEDQYPSCKGSIFSNMFVFNNKR